MRSFSTLAFASAIGAALAFASTASAGTIIFQEDFESYDASATWPNATADVNPGTPPVGSAWAVTESSIDRVQVLSAPSGTNVCAGPHSGNNYLQTWIAQNNAYATIPTVGQQLITDNKNMTLDMWVYKNLTDGWNGLQTIGGYDSAPGDAGGRSFLLYLRQDGNLQYFDGALKDTGLTYTPDTWMHLVVDADFNTHTYDLTLNSQSVQNLAFATNASTISHVALVGSTDVDTLARAAFDDIVMTVNQVPEPGTLVILAYGLVGLLAYAWRKRK